MAKMFNANGMPESIIEYVQMDGPDFQYNESTGAIAIHARESKWLFWKSKIIKTNVKLYYDDDKYNLLFITNNMLKFDFTKRIINSNTDEVVIYNLNMLPKHIKKGELLGIAILVPKVYSHFLKLKK